MSIPELGQASAGEREIRRRTAERLGRGLLGRRRRSAGLPRVSAERYRPVDVLLQSAMDEIAFMADFKNKIFGGIRT